MSDVTGKSIFADHLKDDPIAAQRRAGFFVLRGINPGAIDGIDAGVWRVDKGKCRIRFRRIIPKPGLTEWGSDGVPEGYLCAHGDDYHEASYWDSVDAAWSEVKA